MMGNIDYKLLLLQLLPETILVAGALIVLFLDQATSRHSALRPRSIVATFIGGVTLLVAFLSLTQQGEGAPLFGDLLHLTPFTQLVRKCVYLLGIATLLIARPGKFTRHIGEYVALLLMSVTGLSLLAAAEELLTAFIALELTSLSLYLLTGFNKGSRYSAEAALKYFLFGSVAAAFTLFGISLIFGLAGSSSFTGIVMVLSNTSLSPLMIVALVLVAIGFAFKMAAAPLHLWAPDVYQGAPIPTAALIASGSKLASFVFFFKLFSHALPAQAGSVASGASVPGWSIAIGGIAAVSILVGNLLAIGQSNLRRLLAYSAVAHAGYILIAVLARNDLAAASGVYYLFTYGLTIIGLFAILGALEQRHGDLQISELAGLSRRAPLTAVCLLIFVLSLAGIPPLAGFFGKFYVFIAAVDASRAGGTPGLLWIVVLALAASAVSLFYYLQILKQAFVVESSETSTAKIPFSTTLTVLLLASAVVYLGCFPETLNQPLQTALKGASLEKSATTAINGSK